jgi:hypothetical protein
MPESRRSLLLPAEQQIVGMLIKWLRGERVSNQSVKYHSLEQPSRHAPAVEGLEPGQPANSEVCRDRHPVAT